MTAARAGGTATSFSVTARLDSQVEVAYYKNGGILPYVLRKMMTAA